MTSSWLVSKKFSKDHRHVMRDIRDLIEGVSKIGHTPALVKFIPSTYVHPQNGVEYPLYIMNEDAFSLLVMGFTGEQALKFKLDYIAQFRAMRAYIKKKSEETCTTAIVPRYTPDQEAKIQFASTLIDTDIRMSLGTIAKRITTNTGAKLTRKQLVCWLADNGYICDNPDVKECPTQWALEMGYMLIKYSTSEQRYDRTPKKKRVRGLLTPSGAMHIINLLTRSLPKSECSELVCLN